jgi:hypothetical protein
MWTLYSRAYARVLGHEMLPLSLLRLQLLAQPLQLFFLRGDHLCHLPAPFFCLLANSRNFVQYRQKLIEVTAERVSAREEERYGKQVHVHTPYIQK